MHWKLVTFLDPAVAPLVLGILAAAYGLLQADDRVRYYSSSGRMETAQGQVERFEDGQLQIREPSGRVLQIDQQDIIDADGGWPLFDQGVRGGERGLEEREWGAQVERIKQVYAVEQRPWARHVLLARAARLYRRQEQWDQAASTFLAIARDDPDTIHWADAPLVWQPTELPGRVLQSAERLMDNPLPAAQLIGASWLLSGAGRPRAQRTLDQLADSSDPLVAGLARWQRRRTEVVQVRAEQLADWRMAIDHLPGRLAAGPYFLLGQALSRHGQSTSSALAFLRVGMMYNHDPSLAAEALFMAAGQLEKSGRAAHAQSVYRELLDSYADSRWTPLAREKLLASSRQDGQSDEPDIGGEVEP
jgi:hypothetical protein